MTHACSFSIAKLQFMFYCYFEKVILVNTYFKFSSRSLIILTSQNTKIINSNILFFHQKKNGVTLWSRLLDLREEKIYLSSIHSKSVLVSSQTTSVVRAFFADSQR